MTRSSRSLWQDRLLQAPKRLWEVSELTWYSCGTEVKCWRRCFESWIKCELIPPNKQIKGLIHSREYLKTVPDLLETLMSEKRLLQASVLLVKSLKIINKSDMQEIGAVSDLRGYLVGQETVRPPKLSCYHGLELTEGRLFATFS